MLALLTLLTLLPWSLGQSLAPSTYSVTPSYAKSPSSLYNFSFTAVTPFTASFQIHVFFPSQFSIAGVSNCGFWLNGVQQTGAQCAVAPGSNEVVFTNLGTGGSVATIRVQFNTSTARYSGSYTVNFFYYNTTTQTIINSLTNFLSVAISNAIMSCSLTSTSPIVGDNTTYTLSYTPLVTIQSSSILQLQIQPWSTYSLSNFVTTNTSSICAGMCTLSVPASNGNVSELLRYTGLFGSDTSASGSLVLARARNPASTREITVTVVLLARVSAFSELTYQTCSTTFAVNSPNVFRLQSFTPTVTTISTPSIITLRLQGTNPVSNISYIRIQPGQLALTYQFNNYNQGTQPSLTSTSDGSLLIGNLTTSTTTSPSTLVLNNFTLVNPPFGGKGVGITFSTENLVDGTFYLIDRGIVTVAAQSSTIISAGLLVNNTSINTLSRYTIWFVTVNRLINSSFILLTVPNVINISNSTCQLVNISSNCSILNTTTVQVNIRTIVPARTNLTLSLSSVRNPATTTPSPSLTLATYYEDTLSVVDQLMTGLVMTATSVPFQSVQLRPSSNVVGMVSNYQLEVQLANSLPVPAVMRIVLPGGAYSGSGIGLAGLTIGGVAVTGCTMTNVMPLVVQLESSCFTTPIAASTVLLVRLNNITNPKSTKPTDSWQVQTQFNSLQMQYMNTGIIATMVTPANLPFLKITPNSPIANVQTSYLFELSFAYLHFSGDRVIVTLPADILIGAGFQCLSNSSNVSVSCVQSSPVIIEVSFVSVVGASMSQLGFTISNLRNNWFQSDRSIGVQTTTNASTYYFVEAAQVNVSFVPAVLGATAVSNEQIVLLGQSNISITVTSPFALSRAPMLNLAYLLVNVPIQFTPLGSTCQVSIISAVCSISGQNLNVTSFSDFSVPIVLTFRANTQYFTSTSPFNSTLFYSTSIVASDLTLQVLAFCTNPCKQCNPTPTQCLSCLPAPYTQNNSYLAPTLTCVAVCPDTYYLQSGSCLLCNQTQCFNCQGTSTNCTSCPSGRLLHNNTCVADCPQLFYPNAGQCRACVQPCLRCTGELACVTCIGGFLLDFDNRCVQNCSNLSYIGVNGRCQLCTNNCLTCSISLSNCTSCPSNQFLLLNFTCLRACPSGFYNNINSTCERCVQPCDTCSSRTVCETCIANYYLFNSTTCTRNCPDGTLAVVNRCQPCFQSCATCEVTVRNCTSCVGSLYLYLNDCYETCPGVTYPFNKICTTCLEPCLTCASSPTTCASCIPGKYLLNSACMDACPSAGYYTAGSICVACGQNCLNCASLASCTLCSNDFYLLSGGCTKQCPASHPILVNRVCTSCAPQCATCSGRAENCTSCTVFYFKYSYTCVKQCPLAYFSNQVTYECEDGLSSKIVFFPVLITSFVVIFIILMTKLFTRETSFITTVTSFMSPLELAIWIYVIALLGAPVKQPGIEYAIPIVLVSFGLFSFLVLALVFLFYNSKKMRQDEYAAQWANNNVNYTVNLAVRGLAVVFGCKFFRLIYSRFFNSVHLSAAYKARSNVFTPATIFTVCFIVFSEVPVLAGCWAFVYVKTIKDQVFYTCIEALVVTVIALVFSLMDIYKPEDYFEETEFLKQKKYVEKIKDLSSLNKLEQGFDISHDEGSVDAERFVGTSGGKLMYTKHQTQDFYFEQNEGDSSAPTDVAVGTGTGKKKKKMINIFGPIMEEDGQYYETEKYSDRQLYTEAQLEQRNRKLKSVGSDDEQQAGGKQQRGQQLGLSPQFDDNKSLLQVRDRKKKWNRIIDKRQQLADKIFNKHPPSLQQINDQPLDQQQNDDSNADVLRHLDYGETIQDGFGTVDSQANIRKKRRRRKNKLAREGNKELEAIYLQRLADRKKSGKNLLAVEKSIKYDF